MALWNFYFLAKIYLYFQEFIRLDFIFNVLFLVFLIIPVPKGFKYYKSLNGIKVFIGIVIGFLLFWYDSWLPPLLKIGQFLKDDGLFSMEYIFLFISGFINPWELAVLVFILTVCIGVRNHISLTPVVVVLLLIVPIREVGGSKGEMDKYLEGFYQSESKRVVQFEKLPSGVPEFDIVFLHICSLSWDDLKQVGLEKHPFFKQFDHLFANFNSVTGYSTPSAIRLSRANCGQPSHDALYRDSRDECYLFDQLRVRGYQTFFAMNHDGEYGNFMEDLKEFGHQDDFIDTSMLPVYQIDFNGSSVNEDITVLKKLWKVRQRSEVDRAALYFNSITLHDGAHRVGEREWWKRDRLDSFREISEKLFSDIEEFFDIMAQSQRNVVVIFIPEHGISLKGNAMQAPGLRDIPLPQITTIPVGIKLIGKGFYSQEVLQKVISKPVSYLSLAYILSSYLKHNPFVENLSQTKHIMDKIWETDFVSENQGIRIIKKGEEYYLYGKNKKWTMLSEKALN